VVGGEKAPPVGVDAGPDLVDDGKAERHAELQVVHDATHGERHQSGHEEREPPPPVLLATAAHPQPDGDEHGGADTRPTGCQPVEVGGQHEQPARHDPTPRRSLDHPEQCEHAAHGQTDAPDQVLVEDIGGSGQDEQDGAAHDGGDEDAESGGLGPSHDRRPPDEDAKAPEEEGDEQPEQQPGQQHVRRLQLPVETAGDEQDGHPDDRREQPEVRVGPTVVDEALDTDGALGDPEVTIEHGPGLLLVKVVLVDGMPQQVRALPRHPQVVKERDGPDGDANR